MKNKETIWVDLHNLNEGISDPNIFDKIIYCRLFQHYETYGDDIVDAEYCEICNNICEGEPYFYIENETKKFIVPKLILHYIRKHSLKLPNEVELALQELILPFPKSMFREMAKNHIPKNDINFDPNTKKHPAFHKAAYDLRALKYAYDFGEISDDEYDSQKEILTKIFKSTM